jgi:hypothetical protein
MPDNAERTGPPPRRTEILLAAKNTLTQEIEEKNYVYVGPNAERRFDLNRIRFNSIVTELKQDGYVTYYLEMEHPETAETILVKVLTKGGTTYQDAWRNRDMILKLWANAQSTGKK